jgi:hypothetical protein
MAITSWTTGNFPEIMSMCEGKDSVVEEALSELIHCHNWAGCMWQWPNVEKQIRGAI